MGNSHNSAGQLHSESRLAANKCKDYIVRFTSLILLPTVDHDELHILRATWMVLYSLCPSCHLSVCCRISLKEIKVKESTRTPFNSISL